MRVISVVFFFLHSFIILAQNPQGYYNNASGKSKEELKTALHEIIKHHTILGYGSLWMIFGDTDQRDDGTVWDMYSSNIRTFDTTLGLNREHSFPRSWWGGDKNIAAYTDLNHIFPSDAEANMAKSNHPLGVSASNSNFDNGVSKVGNNVFPGYTGLIFEPADQYKGDFARAYLYMATRYEDYYNKWQYFYMLEANTYPVFKPWAINLLLDWHREDPVSNKELERNEAVFRIQGNRNPFIDFPELAEHIWGNKMEEDWIIDISNIEPVLITPTNATELNFGTVVESEINERILIVKGSNLTDELSVILYGEDAHHFHIEDHKIPSYIANSSSGYILKVLYQPDEVAESHHATILIYDGGIDGSIIVNVYGNSIDPTELFPPTAYEASNITTSGFRANWQEVEGSDFYILNLFARLDGSNKLLFSTEDIFENFFYLFGLETDLFYSYNVEREVKGIRTAPSNTIEVGTITNNNDFYNDTNFLIFGYNNSIYFTLMPESQTHVAVYDVTGRKLFSTLRSGDFSYIVPSPGIYFVNCGGSLQKVLINP